VKRAAFVGIRAFLALLWAVPKRPWRRDADFQWVPDWDVQCPAAAEISVAARHRVSVGRSVSADLVLPQGAFLEERPAFALYLDRDAAGTGQAVLSAADLRALAHPERSSREPKKPLLDASFRGWMVAPWPFLEGMVGSVAAQSAAL